MPPHGLKPAGLTVVMDACIGAMHAMLQVPKKLEPQRRRPPQSARFFSELSDQRVQLIDDGADRFRLAEIDAGASAAAPSGDRCRPT